MHGNIYGTSKEAVEKVINKGLVCLLDIDIQGVQTLLQKDNTSSFNLHPIYVFISPPSLEELERRLRDRGTESEESILVSLYYYICYLL